MIFILLDICMPFRRGKKIRPGEKKLITPAPLECSTVCELYYFIAWYFLQGFKFTWVEWGGLYNIIPVGINFWDTISWMRVRDILALCS